MYIQAALSANVLLALYQCIRQASTPFSLTSSIDCWFQSASVNVVLPGSLFSRMLWDDQFVTQSQSGVDTQLQSEEAV
jgi:hypothetical protein